MGYQFREIRKGERRQVIDFAKANHFDLSPAALHHHLSLMVLSEGQLLGVALCIELEPTQFRLEIICRDGVDDGLITELTDRCLRKVQSANITSARLSSPTPSDTQTIWTHANWLDRIEETPPPVDVHAQSSEAA